MDNKVYEFILPTNPMARIAIAQVYATLALANMTYASTIGFSQGKEQSRQEALKWQRMTLDALKQAGIDD